MPTVFPLSYDPTTARAIAFVATWALAVPLVLVVVAIARDAQRRRSLVEATIAAGATAALVELAALAFVHDRPFVVHHVAPLVAHAADNGFPSDHAAAAGLAVAFLWRRSRASAAIALVAALLLGAARVAAGLHWPVDIAGGYATGALGAVVGTIFSRYLVARLGVTALETAQ